MLAGRLSKDLFLTQQTADGLRVTLKSMLDLIAYLTEHCGFPYVLIGRINQDPLEVCLQGTPLLTFFNNSSSSYHVLRE